jgi:hypothetical protein
VTEQPQPAPAAAEPTPDAAELAAEPTPDAAELAPEPAPAASAVGAEDRPEIAVGAVFAGGFLAALILKRLGR